jgi:hypothetical protein
VQSFIVNGIPFHYFRRRGQPQLDSNLGRVYDAFRAVHEGFQYELKGCIPSTVTNATQFRLGMVVRLCEGGGHACLLADQTDETRVEKMIEWMRPAGAIVANRWYRLLCVVWESIAERFSVWEPGVPAPATRQGYWFFL